MQAETEESTLQQTHNKEPESLSLLTLSQDIQILKDTVNALVRGNGAPIAETARVNKRPRSPSPVSVDRGERKKIKTGNEEFDSFSQLELELSESDHSNDEEDDDYIKELESFYETTEKRGEAIEDRLAKVVDCGLSKGVINGDKIKEICEKYPAPVNCKNLVVPRTNPEIWKLLSRTQQQRDARLQKTQNLVTKSITTGVKLLEEE